MPDARYVWVFSIVQRSHYYFQREEWMIHQTAKVKGHFLLRNVLGDQNFFLYSALKRSQEMGDRTRVGGPLKLSWRGQYALPFSQPSSHTVNRTH